MLTEKELEDIRRKMLELDEETPAWAWSSIQAEIKPKRRWRLLWWLTPALLLITATGLFFIWDNATLLTVAPSVTAHAPLAKPAPKAAEQENISQAEEPQKTSPPAKQQESSLPVKPGNSGNNVNKQPESKSPELPVSGAPGTSALVQPTDKAISWQPINGKETGIKDKKQPEGKYGKVMIIQGSKLADPEDKVKHGNRSKEEYSRLPADTISDKKTAKPGIEKLQPKDPGTNHSVAPEKNLLTEKSKEISQTDSKQNTHATIGSNKETVSNSVKPIPSKTAEMAITPEHIVTADSLIEEHRPDSVFTALETDTASQQKELIIITPQNKYTSKEWAVGLFFSPRYAFRIVTPAVSDDVYITGMANRNTTGSERMGYEIGFSVNKAISRHLYLETSLAFIQLKENLSYMYTTGKIDTLLRQASGDGQQIQITAVYETGNRQLISSYAYGGWRIGASYYFWQNHRRRFNLTMNGGINLLVKGQTREIINGQESKTIYFPSKENILEQTNYNLLIGAGYSMRVMEKYELMLMPTLNYFLGSTFKNREPFGLQPYSLGIHVQLRRRLKG